LTGISFNTTSSEWSFNSINLVCRISREVRFWQYQRISCIRGSFENFVDSHYSEMELCGDAMTVSFSKFLSWQAIHFLQRSTHFSKTCCRPLISSKFLVSELPFRGRESSEICMGRDLDCMADVLMRFHRSTFSKPNTEFNSDLTPCDYWAFPELQCRKFRRDQRSAARFREVGGAS
jgi:hypothetical protein